MSIHPKGVTRHGSSLLRSTSAFTAEAIANIRTGRAPNEPRRRACQSVGSTHGKNASCMRPKAMSRCCTVSRGHLITPCLDSTSKWWIEWWRCGMIELSAWGAPPVPRRCSTRLRRDESLKERGLRRPQSSRTLHRLLREHGRIASRLPRLADP